MISLSNDSLMEVMSYLTYNESKKFSYTCKTVNKVCYLKNLIMNNETDPFNFSIMFSRHNLTLNTVLLYKSITNPQYFMPGRWPKTVSIYYSKITDLLSPNAERTENLKYYSLYETARPLRIDWKKFKNLRSIYIYCENIILDGIEVCDKLENIFIYLNKRKILTNVFGSFKNLKYLITNCDIENNTTFISNDLELFVAKNMSDTSLNFNTVFNIIKDRNKFPYHEETIYNNLKI